MKRKVLGITMALLATLSCVKEKEHELQPEQGEERFAEFDPVVRFGVDTYMGASGPETKTSYGGDDKTFVYKGVRYERINWNAKADATHIQDIIQIKSQTDFTPSTGKKSASYKVVEVKGRTNPTDNSREDIADTEPVTSGEDFYWSASKDKHYFYAVYPTSDVSVRSTTKITSFVIDESAGTDPATHVARVSGSINKKDPTSPATIEASRRQRYITIKPSTGAYEYLPDMTNAFLYAAAAMPGAEAGYKRVQLRFKPLYSAVKLMITGADAGAKNYRLKRVDLRTDLHNNGSSPYRTDLNPRDKGTPLGGAFTTTFKTGADDQTGDFTEIEAGAVTDTLKRLFIEIDQADRMVLGDDTLKVTFLLTPVKHRYLTVDYTFEYLKGSELDPSDPKYLDPSDPSNWSDPANVAEEHRYLMLQKPESKGAAVFDDTAGWYELPAANKLYVRSNVPRIQYFFSVQAQSFLPRTYDFTNTADKKHVPGSTDQYQAQNFYSVVSYRDSAGIKQPLKWRVIGYSETGYDDSFSPSRPAWLTLRGDDGTWDPAHADNKTDPYVPTSGVDPDGDPWSEPWGYGTHMEGEGGGPGQVIKNGNLVGYTGFKKRGPDPGNSFVFYHAGSQENSTAKWTWSHPASFTYRDQDGSYYYPKYNEDGTLHPHSEEAYAYDLSSHDIYGKVYDGFKNGDIVTTANCYVVTATGWYRIPTVYGNAIKDGVANPGAYTGNASASPETLLGQFLDHSSSAITQPWINEAYTVSKGTDGAELVWEDATDLLGANVFSTIMDRKRGDQQKPFFWEDPDTGNGYIYFYVNQLASANAVLKLKSGSTTLWSWHIWCVPDVVDASTGMLAQVAIQPTRLNYYEPSGPGSAAVNPFQSVHADKKFFKKMDLGQSFKETTVPSRKAYVQFAQYWKGEIIDTVVVCFAQSGVNDVNGLKETPVFQWGRKDPLVYTMMAKADATAPSHTLGAAIQNPNTFYYGNNKVAYHGRGNSPGPWGSTPKPTRYDNLWNTNVDYDPETFDYYHHVSFKFTVSWYEELGAQNPREGYSSDDFRFEIDPTQEKGRRDTPVRKTVYDPCPPGFVVPNLYAFTAFNNRGLMETRTDVRTVASNWQWNTSLPTKEDNSFSEYYDFYVGYDENEGAVNNREEDVLHKNYDQRLLKSGDHRNRTYDGKTVKPTFTMRLMGQKGHYRRDTGSETIRFYALGRFGGSTTAGTTTDLQNFKAFGYYWLAEPATGQDITINSGEGPNSDGNGDWAFGSSFHFEKATGTGLTNIYPVAGGWFAPWLQIPGLTGYPSYPYNTKSTSVWGARNKWQRTHGQHIRPMEEPSASGLSSSAVSGSDMSSPGVANPF